MSGTCTPCFTPTFTGARCPLLPLFPPTGFNGEQFALPEAAEQSIEVSATDPLNFHGILIPDERVPAVTQKKVKVV